MGHWGDGLQAVTLHVGQLMAVPNVSHFGTLWDRHLLSHFGLMGHLRTFHQNGTLGDGLQAVTLHVGQLVAVPNVSHFGTLWDRHLLSLAYLTKYSSPEILMNGAINGAILENYTVAEIRKKIRIPMRLTWLSKRTVNSILWKSKRARIRELSLHQPLRCWIRGLFQEGPALSCVCARNFPR